MHYIIFQNKILRSDKRRFEYPLGSKLSNTKELPVAKYLYQRSVVNEVLSPLWRTKGALITNAQQPSAMPQ